MTVLQSRNASVFVAGPLRDYELEVLPQGLLCRDLGLELRLDPDDALVLGSCLVVAGAALAAPAGGSEHRIAVGSVSAAQGATVVALDVDLVLDEHEGIESVLLTCEELALDVTLERPVATRLGTLLLSRG